MTAAGRRRPPVLRTALPEPGNAWVRHHWALPPWPAVLSLDLVRGSLQWGSPASAASGADVPPQPERLPPVDELWAEIETSSPSDAFWVPPGPDCPEARALRDELIHRLASAGLPLVVQQTTRCPATQLPPDVDGRQLRLLDCTASVIDRSLEGDLAAVDGVRVPAIDSWWLLVPLIRGLTTPLVDRVHAAAVALGVAGVFWLVPVLEAADRRRLYERVAAGAADQERLYDGLFHGGEPDLEPVLDAARAAGLETLPPRPLPENPARLRRRREAAGLLFAVGEARRRRGVSEVDVQELNRAALWLDRNDVDVRSLVDDDHLRLIPELRSVRELLARWSSIGSRAVLREEAESAPG